jgi:Amt family ammonium transporter
VWGGGWLTSGERFFQDFAGAGVVHVMGAVTGLAGAIVVGPRIGKYRDGKPVPIPGHSMPLVILGVLLLWVGWQGLNAGSFLGVDPEGIGRVILNTNLSAVFGVTTATLVARLLLGTFDIGMMGNGAVASLGAIAAFAFVGAYILFTLIGATIGLRSSETEELGGLDITEHGMYGYPERFMDVIGATPEEAAGSGSNGH